jgi:hypothetical protein
VLGSGRNGEGSEKAIWVAINASYEVSGWKRGDERGEFIDDDPSSLGCSSV